jgi:flagellar motor switch protein FliN/FliY
VTTPHEVLTQLLSPAQADTLQAVGLAVWRAVANSIAQAGGDEPTPREVNARLVMPDEIASEFEDPHLVVPIQVTTDRDQTALAYLVIPTAIAAMFLDSEADDAGDQEQQTIVIASTMLGQVASALNNEVFSQSTAGLVVSIDDVVANTMPLLLMAMDEPALALTSTLQAVSRILPISLILPGTFLDIVAGAMPAETPVVAAAAAVPAFDLPFSLTDDELELAELVDEMPVPAAAPAREPAAPPQFEAPPIPPTPLFASPPQAASPFAAGPPSAPQPSPFPPRQPIPIAAAPTAHRARFAPLPEADPVTSRSTLDLLAGLQMNVTVELGRTELTVSEVLGLGPGSVVELDRLAGEPVDILVNDRLIARGEVVVVDENFGVRVVEVVRRGEQEERTG